MTAGALALVWNKEGICATQINIQEKEGVAPCARGIFLIFFRMERNVRKVEGGKGNEGVLQKKL